MEMLVTISGSPSCVHLRILSMWIYLMLFTCFIFGGSVSSRTRSSHFRSLENLAFIQPTVLREVTLQHGNTHCMVKCVSTPSCRSVMFVSGQSVCYLLEDHVTTTGLKDSPGVMLSVEKQGGSPEDRVLLFHASAGLQMSAFDLWNSTASTTTWDGDVTSPKLKAGSHYKSALVERWGDLKFAKTEFLFYHNNTKVVRLLFDAAGTDKMSWFSFDRVLESSYSDIPAVLNTPACGTQCFATLRGNSWDPGSFYRKFYMSLQWGGCANDLAWMMVLERDFVPDSCYWANTWSVNWPVLAYSVTGQASSPPTVGDFDFADTMAIFVYW